MQQYVKVNVNQETTVSQVQHWLRNAGLSQTEFDVPGKVVLGYIDSSQVENVEAFKFVDSVDVLRDSPAPGELKDEETA